MKSREQLLLEEAYQEVINSTESPTDPLDVYKYFRGVPAEDIQQIQQLGHALPSGESIVQDFEVLEQLFGDDIDNMSERQITKALKQMIPWYTGKLESVADGVNLTTDFDNAKGYGEYVIAVDVPEDQLVDLDKGYAVARDYTNVKVRAIYDVIARQWN